MKSLVIIVISLFWIIGGIAFTLFVWLKVVIYKNKKGSAKLTKPDQITETDRKESVY